MREINQKAAVKSQKRIKINANVTLVWRLLTDINDWKNWNSSITESKIESDLKIGETFEWKNSGFRLKSTICTYEPLKKIGWTGKSLGVFAIHNWFLEQYDNQTEVIVEESMEGLLTSLFPNYFQKILENGMEKWLIELKNESEKDNYKTDGF